MRLKAKHLWHPFRTAATAKKLLAAQYNVLKLARYGKRHYRGDARYNLQNVVNGFTYHIHLQDEDTKLLERICSAYRKAEKDQLAAPQAYQATDWWKQVQREHLQSVREALRTGKIPILRELYRDFFRNSCSAGLSGIPLALLKPHLNRKATGFQRGFFLSDALYRLDYWKEQINGQFTLDNLQGPNTGNPFGVLVDGTLVRTGSEYQHYCAQKIGQLLSKKTPAVAEIGGGYGGMAYYLMRDNPKITYLDFDTPESIALTAYYLLKSFPERKFLLYGENKLSEETISQYDAVLMPLFDLAKVPAGSVGLTFSSHAVSDISDAALIEYLSQISRITQQYFWCIGNHANDQMMDQTIRSQHLPFELIETRQSFWNRHRSPHAEEVETLYRLGGAQPTTPIAARQRDRVR